jgi:prepilin-type N-terminal cleavage/methylation domain-containing protein
MRKAFTLMELIVALAILALMLSFAGVIFRVSIDSHRLAQANAEIMQKLRMLTEQLDADFRSLRKDGEIFIVWAAERKTDYTGPNRNNSSAFDRFDRIMFFTSGDFHTYGANPRRGNLARVCYTLARGPSVAPAEPNWPQSQKPHKRILARTQHILIPPATPSEQLDTSGFTTDQWLAWNSRQQVDRISMEGWKRLPPSQKIDILSVIGSVTVDDGTGPVSTTEKAARGVLIDRSQPESLSSLFCEGVGQFMVQGWSDAQNRWIPQVNPSGDDSLADTDFLLNAAGADLHPENSPGLWYPRGALTLGSMTYPAEEIDEARLHLIPGLGRALKFTFTLHDSRNLIQNGRTFTHIVYLDN